MRATIKTTTRPSSATEITRWKPLWWILLTRSERCTPEPPAPHVKHANDELAAYTLG
jgi:hypothetical protein